MRPEPSVRCGVNTGERGCASGRAVRPAGRQSGFLEKGPGNVSAELHLARRYLIGLRRRTHVATVTLISLVGLGLGVMALVVTLALLEGFQSSIRAEIVGRAPTPVSSRRMAGGSQDPSKLASVLQDELAGMWRWCRSCVVRAWFRRRRMPFRHRWSAALTPSMWRSTTILAARLGVGRGDEVQVISPRQRLTPMGPLPVRAAGRGRRRASPEPGAESGAVRLPLELAQRLLWGEAVVEAIELRDPDDPWGLGARVARGAGRRAARPLRCEGLEELHRPLLLALALERVMIFVAVGLMLVVAALNLLCNVAMVAAEKRTDLAVLARLGMVPNALRRLFLAARSRHRDGRVGGRCRPGCLPYRWRSIASGRCRCRAGCSWFRRCRSGWTRMVALVMARRRWALAAAASWLPSRLVARREPAEGLRYE